MTIKKIHTDETCIRLPLTNRDKYYASFMTIKKIHTDEKYHL